MSESPLIRSLRAAVAAAPGDVPLRLHLASLLLDAGQSTDAVGEIAVALQHEPASSDARALMARALGAGSPPPAAPSPGPPMARPPTPRNDSTDTPVSDATSDFLRHDPTDDASGPGDTTDIDDTTASDGPSVPGPRIGPGALPPTVDPDAASDAGADPEAPDADDFDWQRAERDFAGVCGPMFVDGDTDPEPTTIDLPPDEDAFDVEASTVRLADVGGMEDVKRRLEAAFLAPMRNPALRRLYGKSLRGGLLLYGPPGCGKTFIARAVAGEIGARFLAVSVTDVLDMWLGTSERNLREIFAAARRSAPCVLFLDEVDALGQKRSHIRSSGLRTIVNTLLSEMDSVAETNEGVFVLAATNHPWDVDTALRRPGRLDRMLLVLPPDQAAREAILRYHLRHRPVEGIDLPRLARRTDGFSGADLAHLAETAAERALMDSVDSGRARMIGMRDLETALQEVKPSTGPWFAAARNVAMFANEGGVYDDLLTYLKRHRMV